MSNNGLLTQKERILGGLWGSLVGDALGVPVEFMDRAKVRHDPVMDMREYGTHRQPRGTWSDDGALILCTADSLLNHDFNLADMGDRFVRWMNDGLWTAWGEPFDIGVATSDAIVRIANGTPAEMAGGRAEECNGNGSLMRILPVALRFAAEPLESFASRLERASAITHGHCRSRMACVFYGLIIRHLLFGKKADGALDAARSDFAAIYERAEEFSPFRAILETDLAALPEDDVDSTGYVLHTLHASLWCLLTTGSFRDCVLKAVNLGGDTDTTGCVAGGLAGVAYGRQSLPTDWINQLARQDDLTSLLQRFAARCEESDFRAGSQPTLLPVRLELRERINGLLLGTAVGDALGLPAEGLSRERIQRMWKGQWRHRFLFGRGMISDDTEHTVFVAQALLEHPDNAAAFQRSLAWKLRLWLLGLPAGIGLATLKAIVRLWLGFPPDQSGVWSAGNGPAMRSAILGAYFSDDPENRRAFVTASTRLTHTDPKAETAAQAVAEVAAQSVNQNLSTEELLANLANLGNDAEWQIICQKLSSALNAKKTVAEFAESLGLAKGISGYAYHSVPVAIYAGLRHPDNFRNALISALDCGGDTDTVGAITGALAGVRRRQAGIPQEWLDGICDQPRSVRLLEKIGTRLVEQKNSGQMLGPVRYFWPVLIIRSICFMTIVLWHGFRRLLPPYDF